MNWKVWLLSCCLCAVLSAGAATGQTSAKSAPQSSEKGKNRSVTVPEQVAVLLRPILDEKQKGSQHDERRLNHMLYGLAQTKGRVADEALVVLMCFDVGESQEETDAVVARGRRMLPYLKKYQSSTPKISDRTYPNFMLKGAPSKADAFEGALKAINKGWHSTADNPGVD